MADRRIDFSGAAPTSRPRRSFFVVFDALWTEHAEIGEVVDSLELERLGTDPKIARLERDFASRTSPFWTLPSVYRVAEVDVF